MHHHRTEHWIVVTGTAEVEIDSKKLIIGENKSIYIPLGSTHRLSNTGKRHKPNYIYVLNKLVIVLLNLKLFLNLGNILEGN